MSLTTVTSSPSEIGQRPSASDRVPFTRVMRVELRKSLDTRSGRWLLLSIALISAGLIALSWFTRQDHPQGAPSFHELLMTVTLPQTLLLPLVGILCVTSEFSQRTALTTFALEPRRPRVMAAKAAAVLTLGVALSAVAALASAIVTAFVARAHPGVAVWDVGWSRAGGFLAFQAVLLLWGLAFGLAFRNSPAAIVTYLALPMVWTILLSVVTGLSAVQPWLDLNPSLSSLAAGTMSSADWAHLATGVGAWVALPAALGLWRVVRTELR